MKLLDHSARTRPVKRVSKPSFDRLTLTAVLASLITHPGVAAEAGIGSDEANRVSTRVHGICPNPCWLK